MISHKYIYHIKMRYRRITQHILMHEIPKPYCDLNVKTYCGLKAKTHDDLKIKHNITWKSKHHVAKMPKHHVAKMPKHCQEFQEVPGRTHGFYGDFIPLVGVVPTLPYMSTAFRILVRHFRIWVRLDNYFATGGTIPVVSFVPLRGRGPYPIY